MSVQEEKKTKETEYRFCLHPGGLLLTRALAENAGLKPQSHLLDIGCGTGTSLAMLRDEFRIIPTGLDCSEKALRIGRKSFPDLTLKTGDASSLPFESTSFDAVLLECVLTLLPAPAEALCEAARVLRPGGLLLISSLTLGSDAPHPSRCSASADDRLCRNGLLMTGCFYPLMHALGFSLLYEEDRREDLIRYLAESILQYGSLKRRIQIEQERTGTAVFCFAYEYSPKSTGYQIFVFRKT